MKLRSSFDVLYWVPFHAFEFDNFLNTILQGCMKLNIQPQQALLSLETMKDDQSACCTLCFDFGLARVFNTQHQWFK